MLSAAKKYSPTWATYIDFSDVKVAHKFREVTLNGALNTGGV